MITCLTTMISMLLPFVRRHPPMVISYTCSPEPGSSIDRFVCVGRGVGLVDGPSRIRIGKGGICVWCGAMQDERKRESHSPGSHIESEIRVDQSLGW